MSQRYCNGVSNTLTKLAAVKYHPQYEDSLKQERELAQEEIAQLLKELKSKGEQIQQNQESQKQLEITQQEIVQLKEKLKSEEEFVLKLEQESQEQLKDKDQKIRDAKQELQHFLENESKKDEQIQACEMEVKNFYSKARTKI